MTLGVLLFMNVYNSFIFLVTLYNILVKLKYKVIFSIIQCLLVILTSMDVIDVYIFSLQVSAYIIVIKLYYITLHVNFGTSRVHGHSRFQRCFVLFN